MGAGIETVVGRRTGTWTKVITIMKDRVVAVGFDNGRYRCWGRHPRRWCGSYWGGRHREGGGGSLGVNTRGTIVTLRESAVGVRLSTLRDGAGKLGWTATRGAGRIAVGSGAVGGMAVTLEKMQESAWIAAN